MKRGESPRLGSNNKLPTSNLLSNCVGKVLAGHDDRHAYQLPFPPHMRYRVIQGYGGSYSHTGYAQYSLDFAMPEGTPVCAARGGVVASVIDRFSIGGVDPKLINFCNLVSIRHLDGSLASYCHLMKGGVCVKVGQRVMGGDVIARSGNTGWSSVPHLHFHVQSTSGTRVATMFSVGSKRIEYLEQGKLYPLWHWPAFWNRLFRCLGQPGAMRADT